MRVVFFILPFLITQFDLSPLDLLPSKTSPFLLLPLPPIQYVMWVTMFHVFYQVPGASWVVGPGQTQIQTDC